MSQLSEQEDKLNQQVVSLQHEISKAISEKEHLARENERYLNALNKTVSSTETFHIHYSVVLEIR